jgi:hypothetical protein
VAAAAPMSWNPTPEAAAAAAAMPQWGLLVPLPGTFRCAARLRPCVCGLREGGEGGEEESGLMRLGLWGGRRRGGAEREGEERWDEAALRDSSAFYGRGGG